MRYILWATMLIILPLLLFGCISFPEEQLPEQSVAASLTATLTPIVTTPLAITRTYTPMPDYAATLQLSATGEATVSPPSTSTSDAPATATVDQLCAISEPIQVEQTDLARGLILNRMTEIVVLGNTGMQDPAWISQYPDNNTSSIVSPNGDWTAFMTYNVVDREKDIYTVSVQVADWNRSQGFQTQLVNLTLSRFASSQWINDSQIIFPLAHEGDLLQWFVWSPFNGESETHSIELTGLSQRSRFLEYAYPGPDPLLELVVYPCEACNGAEYAVKRLQTGETEWFIDLGPNPSYDYRSHAYWSPDGAYVVVLGGQFLNHLLFFNRAGERVYEIILPLLDEPGSLPITAWSWSPNNKYLAFLRVAGSTGQYTESLSLVDMQDGRLIDLCVNATTGPLIWSPDSTRIAFSQQVQSGEQPRLISIVDIQSGNVIQLYDAEAHTLAGWIDYNLLDDK